MGTVDAGRDCHGLARPKLYTGELSALVFGVAVCRADRNKANGDTPTRRAESLSVKLKEKCQLSPWQSRN